MPTSPRAHRPAMWLRSQLTAIGTTLRSARQQMTVCSTFLNKLPHELTLSALGQMTRILRATLTMLRWVRTTWNTINGAHLPVTVRNFTTNKVVLWTHPLLNFTDGNGGANVLDVSCSMRAWVLSNSAQWLVLLQIHSLPVNRTKDFQYFDNRFATPNAPIDPYNRDIFRGIVVTPLTKDYTRPTTDEDHVHWFKIDHEWCKGSPTLTGLPASSIHLKRYTYWLILVLLSSAHRVLLQELNVPMCDRSSRLAVGT